MSRAKILNAAMKIFSEHGYHRASMDEIALQANVAKGTLYYHFPSKAQLFKTLVSDGFQKMMERIESDLETDLPLEEQIRRIIGHNLNLYLECSDFAHIVFNELSNSIDEEVLAELRKLREDYIRFISGILEEGRKAGVVREVNCQLAAAAMIGMLDGSCNYLLSRHGEVPREQLETFLYTLITDGLLSTSL